MLNPSNRSLRATGMALRPRGGVLANILGQSPDAGTLPGRPNWEVNPLLNSSADVESALNMMPAHEVSDAPALDIRPPANSGVGQPGPVGAQGGPPDYGKVLMDMLGPRPEMGTGQKIAAIVGPALMAASGNEAAAMQMMGNIGASGRSWDASAREAGMQSIKWQREDDAAEAKRNEPQIMDGNEDRVRYDPRTGTAERIYDAPEDFEIYAATQGLEPGSDEYFSAVEDYVLRGNGPTAFQYDRDLETIRNAGRISLENARQSNRVGLEDRRSSNRSTLRGQPTYRDLNPPAPRATRTRSAPRIAEVSTPAEARALPKGTRFRTPDGKIKVR